MSFQESNRQKVQSNVVKRLHWCDRCDRNLVSPHEKCAVCGFQPKGKNRFRIRDVRKTTGG